MPGPKRCYSRSYKINSREDAMMKRLLAATFAAVFAFAAVPGMARAENTKLTLMVFIGIQNLPLYAAQSQGFFAKRGLDVDIQIAQNSDTLRQGLADGKWQIVHTAFDNGVAMADVAKVDISLIHISEPTRQAEIS